MMYKVWFITSAGRGMGVDFARAALAAGHQVVATDHRLAAVEQAISTNESLLAVNIVPANAEAAV
jgi:NAD(P)-dependent dehydrogenase (short-subunit alcohol dehydrogenase family)